MIQLDTHVLLWRELEPERLSHDARAAIESAVFGDEAIAISVVTFWEIALLAQRQRILLKVPIQQFLQEVTENYEIFNINAPIAIQAADFNDPFPRDPMDRLIAATAFYKNSTLITADRSILASKVCKTLW